MTKCYVSQDNNISSVQSSAILEVAPEDTFESIEEDHACPATSENPDALAVISADDFSYPDGDPVGVSKLECRLLTREQVKQVPPEWVPKGYSHELLLVHEEGNIVMIGIWRDGALCGVSKQHLNDGNLTHHNVGIGAQLATCTPFIMGPCSNNIHAIKAVLQCMRDTSISSACCLQYPESFFDEAFHELQSEFPEIQCRALKGTYNCGIDLTIDFNHKSLRRHVRTFEKNAGATHIVRGPVDTELAAEFQECLRGTYQRRQPQACAVLHDLLAAWTMTNIFAMPLWVACRIRCVLDGRLGGMEDTMCRGWMDRWHGGCDVFWMDG